MSVGDFEGEQPKVDEMNDDPEEQLEHTLEPP